MSDVQKHESGGYVLRDLLPRCLECAALVLVELIDRLFDLLPVLKHHCELLLQRSLLLLDAEYVWVSN